MLCHQCFFMLCGHWAILIQKVATRYTTDLGACTDDSTAYSFSEGLFAGFVSKISVYQPQGCPCLFILNYTLPVLITG